MKNFCITLFCLSIIVLTIVLSGSAQETREEYLRIHIRADSNEGDDQAVKYKIRNVVVEYLTPIVAVCQTKQELQKALKSHINGIESVANEVLLQEGFTYSSSAKVTEEEFPTRVYDGLTLQAGYYDALIINLGSGKGDNWWCVVYPPLCFYGKQTGEGFRYKSKLLEIITDWKARYS